MAAKTEQLHRGTIASRLKTSLVTYDRDLAHPADRMTEGGLVAELGNAHKYAEWRAGGQKQFVRDSVPVHWLALVPRKAGGLAAVEFGVGRAALGIPYDAAHEREALRADLVSSEPSLAPEVAGFYRQIRPSVIGRVAHSRLLHPRHAVFAAAERRYPIGAEGDPELGWTQIIASRRLVEATDVVDNHIDARHPMDDAPLWMRQAGYRHNPENVAEANVLKRVALTALADVVRERHGSQSA